MLNPHDHIIVSDSSVLINFLKIDRLDLLGSCSLHFLITEHVKNEIKETYPDQLNQLQMGLEKKYLEEIKVEDPIEMDLFSIFIQEKRLGIGECSAMAVAICRKYLLAIDDNLAIKSALSYAPYLSIKRTKTKW